MNHQTNTSSAPFSYQVTDPTLSTIIATSWVEINDQAIRNNITQFKQFVGPDKMLGIVLKSNAYGHGLLQIAQLCEIHTAVDYLLVAHVAEAVTLRQSGIIKKILIISAIRDNLAAAVHYDCDIMVTDTDVLNKLQAIGIDFKKKINIHLKVDTGLSRFGFAPDEIIPLLHLIKRMSHLNIMGIYTHFAESNASDLTFTYQQEQAFNTLLNAIERAGFVIPLRHCSNSAATTALSRNQVNFFRLGAGAYGIWPSQANHALIIANNYPISLTPALEWKTKIIHIKTIPADSFVGYNRTYQTDKEMKIAIIPVGYYDGYDKRLSNKGIVLINGQPAPIIGTIAMNATTIDITDIPDIKLDDTVTLIGTHRAISPAELAITTGCLNARQITTQINPTIPRLFLD